MVSTGYHTRSISNGKIRIDKEAILKKWTNWCFTVCLFSVPKTIHPWRLTWNIIMEVWKIMFLSKWVICRFHVNLPGCILFEKTISQRLNGLQPGTNRSGTNFSRPSFKFTKLNITAASCHRKFTNKQQLEFCVFWWACEKNSWLVSGYLTFNHQKVWVKMDTLCDFWGEHWTLNPWNHHPQLISKIFQWCVPEQWCFFFCVHPKVTKSGLKLLVFWNPPSSEKPLLWKGWV